MTKKKKPLEPDGTCYAVDAATGDVIEVSTAQMKLLDPGNRFSMGWETVPKSASLEPLDIYHPDLPDSPSEEHEGIGGRQRDFLMTVCSAFHLPQELIHKNKKE